MRLPQDYILHIESAKDGVHITAEWQGELVRCKDCIHGERDTVYVYCTRYYRRIGTEDYCSSGERRKDANTD